MHIPTEQELGIPTLVGEDESLTKSLTGGQIQNILDELIYCSLAPLIRTSKAFDLQVVYLLGMTAKNRKRKLSALDRTVFISTLCHCLITNDAEKKISLLSEAKIERSFVYNFVVKFLESTNDYIELYRAQMLATTSQKLVINQKLRAIESNVGADLKTLYTSINEARSYLELAYEFRNNIVKNYLRHAYKQARAFCANKQNTTDFNCVYQNFLTSIIKAVDKYDCSKGALTSYINFWILNAQTTNNSEHGHEYGIAFAIPQLQRKAMAMDKNHAGSNFSVSIDAKITTVEGMSTALKDNIVGCRGLDDDMEQRQEENTVQHLIKAIDKKGLARLYLGIDETYNEEEFAVMREVMIRQQVGAR